jgi:DNA polymerase-3 subunit gamma/tau
MSIKEKEKNKQKELIESTKKTDLYKTVMEYFPDAELIEVRPTTKDDDK